MGSVKKDLRQTWREGADEASPAILQLWKEVVEGATKEYSHTVDCPCGRKHKEVFHIPDLRDRSAAAKSLMEFGWGRPGTVDAEKDLSVKPAEEMSSAERRALLAEVRKRLGGVSGGKAVDGGEEQAAE